MDYKEELDIVEEMEDEEEVVIQDHPIFVCKTVIDRNSQQEASQAALGKSGFYTSLALYGMCAVMGVYLILDSIIHSHWQKNGIMLFFVAAITVFTIYSRISAPKRAMNHWEEALIKRYGSPALHVTTEFYNLSLAQTIQEDEEQFVGDGYSSIMEVVETENMLLLRHGKNQYYFVAKNGFVQGNAEQFKTFIQERIGGK